MPYKIIQLGPVSLSSASVTANGLVDDAERISFWVNGTTTSVIQLQAELTDTGTNFIPVSPTAVTSGATVLPYTATSSAMTIVTNSAFSQIKFVSTGAVATPLSIIVAKHILV